MIGPFLVRLNDALHVLLRSEVRSISFAGPLILFLLTAVSECQCGPTI